MKNMIDRRSFFSLPAYIGAYGLTGIGAARAAPRRSREAKGVNLIETANAPFGSARSAEALKRIRALGADSVAVIPFFWQPMADSPELVFGDALPPKRLRLAIRQARDAGLRCFVKPHVWVPERWAGAIAMQSEADWTQWFGRYGTALNDIAVLANEERADGLFVGTELRLTSRRSEWAQVIADAKARFPGSLSYVAHGPEEAATVPFWAMLDAVSVSLYPALGDEPDRWRDIMARALAAANRSAASVQRPLWIAEIGVRSATGAASRPWESAEERDAAPDQALQARVIDDWLTEIESVDAGMALIWRWFTDPDAGGDHDTDFTIQNKAAEAVLRRHWRRHHP